MATSIFHKNFPQVSEYLEQFNQAKYVIGLDLHKKTTALTVIDKNHPEKPVFQRKRLDNREVLPTIQRFDGKKIAISESSYGWVRLQEALAGIPDVTFLIFDPRKTMSWAQSSGIKSDKLDAEVLAYACLNGGISGLSVFQNGKESRENFKLSNYRDSLVRQSTRVKNQLKAFERDFGPNPYTGEVLGKSEIATLMENGYLDQLNVLKQKIDTVDEHMKNFNKKDEISRLLKTIPGIGNITAFAMRAKIEDISRFENAKHLMSFFGLGIRQSQSGDHCSKGKITKTGNRMVRKLLVQGAQIIRSSHPEYLPLYFPHLGQPEAMANKQHANKVTIALARKNLDFVYHVWKTKEKFSIDIYREKKEKALNLFQSKNNVPSSKTVDPDLMLIR